MKDVLSNNAFGILGILPDTSQKEISKRGKELLKLLKFGDNLTYPYDFDFYSSKRTENTINEAINELSDIQKRRIRKYFFENKTFEEIAKEENCTKRAVKFTIDIALEKISKKFQN